MRRTILVITFVLLTLPYVVHAQQKISFDLKTHFSEKLDLAPAKNGTLLFLMESEWAGVTELGEDYALWLTKIARDRRGDTVTVTLDVELRSGSLFEEGELLASKKIVVRYNLHDDWKAYAGKEVARVITTGETCVAGAVALGEAIYPGPTKAVERIAALLEEMMPEDYDGMKLEAMAVGCEVVRSAREMTAGL